jgi:hypothetical protein
MIPDDEAGVFRGALRIASKKLIAHGIITYTVKRKEG